MALQRLFNLRNRPEINAAKAWHSCCRMTNEECRLATGLKDKFEPLKAYKKEVFKVWQEDQGKENFNRPYVLSFIYLEPDTWLFAGVYEVLGVKKSGKGFTYETRLSSIGEGYYGRLFIKFKRARAAYLLGENVVDQIVVEKVLNGNMVNIKKR